MLYENFPKVMYNKELIVDISRVLKIPEAIKQNASLFADEFVRPGETIEGVAYRFYGDVYKNYLIILMNDITDPFYDWPLSIQNLQRHVTLTYGEGHEDDTHHYEVDGKIIELDAQGNAPFNAVVVTNRTHEDRINEAKRQIRVLRREHIGVVEAELSDVLNK